MADQNPGSEQEITLRDYVNVIVKQKKLIFAVFFIFVIAAIAISFTIPNTREVSMLIEIGNLGAIDAGNTIFVDLPANTMAKIEMGVFNANVIDALKLDQQDAGFRIKVSQIRDSALLELRIREPEDKKELGIKILNQYFNEISDFYKKTVDSRIGYIDKKISFFSDRIRGENDWIKLCEENLKIYEAQESSLMNELKNTAAVNAALQQNIYYINQINNQLMDMRLRKANMLNDIKAAQREIGDFNSEMERLKSVKDSIHNFILITAPRVSSGSLGPSSIQNVLAGGIAGLILGMFMAFFVEYWQGLKRL